MKIRNIVGLMLISIALASVIPASVSADTLLKTDFQLESWAKTVDYFDYVRAYATLNGIETPQGFGSWHANVYMTYVNTSGLHLLYAGLENVTFGGSEALRIPMQSFIMHYKTDNRTRDVIMASTFLMLMAFNETKNSLIPDSPDMDDELCASFSLGFDLSSLNVTLPTLNSKTETIPLEHSNDKLQWTWGMKYTNLTALWWRTWINPVNPHFEGGWPVALTVYDELTFTYNLTISPETHTATLAENHVIGRMRDLLIFAGPFWVHFNSTGTYLFGTKVQNDTIYDFVQNGKIKMSIVDFQTSVLADHETYSVTSTSKNVTDSDTPISDTSITTYADDGEKIFDANFGAKKSYRLYNYTADPTETIFSTYNSTARTAKIAGFAGNAGLFTYQKGLMKFLPLVVVHMYPQLFARAQETITNMSRANYFYVIAYPNYSGYKVEHDPTFTVYLASTPSTPANPPNLGGIIVLLVVGAAVAITIAIIVSRRKPRLQPLAAQQSIQKPST